MVTVFETWRLKPGLEASALALMQEMDCMLGPPAHRHPGWCGHAEFYQSAATPTEVLMVYPWRSRELHEDLAKREEPELQKFYADYCTAPREIRYYDELAVDVDHDHDMPASQQADQR
jgi:hypothetical protein